MIDETAREIEEMRTHSSSTVARKAAIALGSLADRKFQTVDEFVRALEQNSKVLRQANSSHAWLQSSQREIIEEIELADPENVEEAATILERTVTAKVEQITAATDQAGAMGATLLEAGDTVVTHDFSNTVLAAITEAIDAGKELGLIVSEARPRFLGRRMARTASTIDGVSVTLIVDSAVGTYLDDIDHVMVGMDCIVEDQLYNRVGTCAIASLADRQGVPVSTLGAAAKIVDRSFEFKQDEREAVEVMREPSPEFAIGNPAYDATPLDLVTNVVTDNGIDKL